MTYPWLARYPGGVPAEIDPLAYPSLPAMMAESFARHAAQPACRCDGRSFSYREIDERSRSLAAWWMGQGLGRGDRVAVMMPNVPQVLVAVAAILRAGCVVVNVNPLATPRELEAQLKDSGAKGIVVFETFASTLQAVLPHVPARHVLLAAPGDMLGWLRGALANHVARHVRKQVPPFELPGATRFGDALAQGRSMPFEAPALGPGDIAVVQYTGGTSGTPKGAVLLHRNLVANVLQSEAWFRPALARVPADEPLTFVCALPLSHLFGFSLNLLLGLRLGACNLLIPNARDIAGTLATLSGETFHSFPATNTLFGALMQHPDFARVDWSSLKLSVGGGMAVQASVARSWLERTGCPICEGYGLSETSPTVCCNPVDTPQHSGTIGLPLPSTEVRILDDHGQPLPAGQAGEIAVCGPQVMAGYWQRPDETAKAMTADGCFRTGDIGMMDEQGSFRIVDRKRDIVRVSGFEVVPNEVEDVMSAMPGVLECAAVGVPDSRSGEAVKLVVVRKDPDITEADVYRYAQAQLTGPKRPTIVEFRAELPKTSVGKVLRRELRA